VKDLCGSATYTSTQFCQSGTNAVKDFCGTATYTSTQFCQVGTNAVKDLCGSATYTSTQFCQGPNVVKPLCDTSIYASTQYCKNGTTLTQYGSLEYAGQTYRTVVIGTQTWMAENLNYNASNSRCHGDNSGGDSQGNCAKYGRLYNWSTAMGIDAKYNSEFWGGIDVKRRGICPTGWHLPRNAEWTTLTYFVGGSSTAGTELKATSGWNDYNGNSGNGTDRFGFSALPGGIGYSDGGFYRVGDYGYWWSASEYDSDDAYYRIMYYYSERVFDYYNDKSYLFSVRCLQD